MSCSKYLTEALQPLIAFGEINSAVAFSGSHVYHFCKLAIGGTISGNHNRQTPGPRSYSTVQKSSVSKSNAHSRPSRLQARHYGVRRVSHGTATLHRTETQVAPSAKHWDTQNATELQHGASGAVSSSGFRSLEASASKDSVPSQGPKKTGDVIVKRSRNTRSPEASANTFRGLAKPGVYVKSHTERKGRFPSLTKMASPASGDVESKRETWQVQKSALSEKFGSSGWSPRKRLSPDSLEGIRALHAQYPDKFTTSVLADHFKVSPEAVRRILKSKWRPNEEEEEERRERWNRRGMTIWAQMNELGVKPPRKWRDQGVGKFEEQPVARQQQSQFNQPAGPRSKRESHSVRLPGISASGLEVAQGISLADRIQ